jgi:putative oxidoreductase
LSHLLEPFLPSVAYLALAVRIWVGITLMIHGRPKLDKKNRDQAINFFGAKGVPPAGIYIGALLEFFGGLLLVVGFLVPIVAFLEAVYFLGIIAVKRTKDDAKYVAPGKPNFELDAYYVLISIVLVVLGAGAFSIDGLVGL